MSKDVDEVLLALNEAKATFIRDGHQPNAYAHQNCQGCHTLHLLQRAIDLYLTTRVVVINE